MDFRYITYILNGLLMIAIPIFVAIILARKYKLDWGLWFVGAGIFIFSQIGHIPFNVYVISPLFNKWFYLSQPSFLQVLSYACVIGLSAGIFEELFRFGMFRWWVKEARSWSMGLMAGAGHGGAEAIIFGIISLVILFEMTAYRETNFAALSTLSADQAILAQLQVNSYWGAPWYQTLPGTLERSFTIPVQISLSVIILQTFIRKQWFWILIAILYHTIIDAGAVAVSQYFGIYWTEALVGCFSIFSLFIIIALRQPESSGEAKNKLSSLAIDARTIAPLIKFEESSENLNDTKYQ
jgi:uncharacterized membrane protein YhfC